MKQSLETILRRKSEIVILSVVNHCTDLMYNLISIVIDIENITECLIDHIELFIIEDQCVHCLVI